jgi:hypothetical protein
MAVPRLATLAHQIRGARHEARVEDQLAEDPPLIRLEMRAWKGPMTHIPNPPFSTMEIQLEEGETAEVVVRMWVDPTVAPDEEARMPAVKLRAAWLDELAFRFVSGVLDRA